MTDQAPRVQNTRAKFGDYEAWVTIGQQEIEHYDVEVDEEKKLATCWIASRVGEKFEVNSSKSHTKFGCCADFYLDGTLVSGKALRELSTGVGCCAHVETPEGCRSFIFSSLLLSDEDALLNDPSANSIGDIKVVFFRADIGDSLRVTSTKVSLNTRDKVHERSKKAIPHKVGFAPVTGGTPKLTYLHTTRHEVVATFIIRYRTLEILQANGIAPLPLKPRGSSKKRSAEDSEDDDEEEEQIDPQTAEQLQEEAELLARLKKVQENLKDKRPKKKVKEEIKPIALKGRSGEVIDLTLD